MRVCPYFFSLKGVVRKNIRFFDMFSGIGGFREGLNRAGGFSCVGHCEIDKYADRSYRAIFNTEGEWFCNDAKKIRPEELPEFDLLCGGFPCQAFSVAGKRQGFEDARGTLFFDVARIVKAKRPKVVFMENVKNFATHDDGKTLEVVKGTMEELGYKFYQKVLNAVDYGVPQKRERIYMVCFRNDLEINDFKYPKTFELTRHVEDFLLEDEEMVKDLYVDRPDTYYNGVEDNQYSNKSIRLGIVNKGGQGERIYSTKGIAITLSAYGGGVFAKTGGYLINGKTRKLHPRECARIMGYPDSYKICKSANQAYKQFGNSVVIDVLQLIAVEIGTVMEGK